MNFDKKKNSAKIAALRKDRKLTQEQLAEKVGITVQYLGTIERGKNQYHINRLDRIADVMGCSFDELIFSTTPLDTLAASMSAKCLSRARAILRKPYLKNWMSKKLRQVLTENK